MKFAYKARGKEGKEQKGVIEAGSKKKALELLEKHAFYVTSLRVESSGIFSKKLDLAIFIAKKDIVIFTRQFSIMLKSAIPPLEALKAQISQTKNEQFRDKIISMAEMIETGGSLSRAFSLHPKIFDPFYVSIIKSGEATGKVAESLSYLADHLERSYALRSKIRSAMIYPGFVIMVFVGAFFLVTFFIIPRLTEILVAFTGDLPLSTRALMGMSDFTRKGGWVFILIGIGFLFIAPLILKRFKTSREIYDRFILRVPVLGPFKVKIYLTQFSENLSVLIAAGLPITQALTITREIVDSSVYKNIIEQAEKRVSRGEKMSIVFSGRKRHVPPFVVQMLATGEETGRLEETLMNVVKFYQDEIERTAENLTTILEPLLILTLGVGIAIMAVALFIPLFQIGMGGI